MSDLFNMSSAEFSPCGDYRYSLWRWWDKPKGYCMFIGLNPSTADAENDDPTIRRCKRFAKDFGYGGLCMANLFALRATNPKDMLSHANPIGPENDRWLCDLAHQAGMIVVAWGTHGGHRKRDQHVCFMLECITGLKCLKLTKKGYPQHPLYLPADSRPIEFNAPPNKKH